MPNRRKRRSSSSSGCASCLLAPFTFLIWITKQIIESFEWLFRELFDNSPKPQVSPKPSQPLAPPQQRSGGIKPNSIDNRFTEIIPGGRPVVRQSEVTVSYHFDSIGIRFLKESQQYHSRVENPATPAPFMRYWSSFSDMDDDQKRWYFYWRTQYRKGNALPTDYSYLFIYSYEIINLVEVSDPVAAAGHLWVLWTKYRLQYPKLDQYLPSWGGDLLAIKQGVETGILWWEHAIPIVNRIPDDIMNLIIDRYVMAKRTRDLPQRLILMPFEYRARTKYFQEHNQNGRLDNAFQKAILLVDDYSFRVNGESIFTKYTSPTKYPIQIPAFPYAPVGIPHPAMINWGEARHYLWTDELRTQLIYIGKYVENLMRTRDGYTRKLSGIVIPPDLAKLLDSEFAPSAIIAEPVKVHIDQIRANARSKESDEVSKMLATLVVDEAAAPAKPLYTDLAGMRKLWRKLDLPSRLLIAGIFHKKLITAQDISHWQSTQPIPVSKLMEEINAQAVTLLGDHLIYLEGQDPVLSEDYLDELDVVIAESPSESQPTPLSPTADTENPWEPFFERLTPPEIALVQQIAKEGSLADSDLDKILRPFGAMANATVDGVNEKAIDVVNHPRGRPVVRRPEVMVSYQFDSIGIRFLKESQQFHSRVENAATPAPFMRYWPTFSDMDDNQKRWYFYWRGQYRKGNALSTDYSYLFVYSYELLNLVEVPDPVAAAGNIWVLWTKYRSHYPKLDQYLPSWGGDLLAIKKNIETAILWWEHAIPIVQRIPDDISNLIIDRYIIAKRTQDLPQRLILMPLEYRSMTKYYEDHNQNSRLDNAFQKAILLADEYSLRVNGESIFTKYTSPKKYPIQKAAFPSAPVGISHPAMINWGEARQYLCTDELREPLINIIKYTENLMRKRDGYARKLSGIVVPPDLAKILDSEFSPSVIIPEPVKMHIDQARANALAKESDEVTKMLATLVVDETAAPAKPLYTDLAGMRKLWRKMDLPARLLIAGIFRKEIKDAQDISHWQSTQPIPVSKFIEVINAQAVTLLGDRLIYSEGQDPAVAEDYMDELDVVIAESPPESQPTPLSPAADTENPWEAFFEKLSPPEIALVQQIAKEGSLADSDLDKILRPFGAMANAIIDSFNEKAIDSVNHPLAYLDNDRWIAEEEDLRELRYHLFGAEK